MIAIMLLLLISVATTCKIKTKVIAETYHPVWAQFTFHNGTNSKVYKLDENHRNYTLNIEGLICNLKPTVLKSYKKHPKPGVKAVGQTSAFIEGHGILTWFVDGLDYELNDIVRYPYKTQIVYKAQINPKSPWMILLRF